MSYIETNYYQGQNMMDVDQSISVENSLNVPNQAASETIANPESSVSVETLVQRININVLQLKKLSEKRKTLLEQGGSAEDIQFIEYLIERIESRMRQKFDQIVSSLTVVTIPTTEVAPANSTMAGIIGPSLTSTDIDDFDAKAFNKPETKPERTISTRILDLLRDVEIPGSVKTAKALSAAALSVLAVLGTGPVSNAAGLDKALERVNAMPEAELAALRGGVATESPLSAMQVIEKVTLPTSICEKLGINANTRLWAITVGPDSNLRSTPSLAINSNIASPAGTRNGVQTYYAESMVPQQDASGNPIGDNSTWWKLISDENGNPIEDYVAMSVIAGSIDAGICGVIFQEAALSSSPQTSEANGQITVGSQTFAEAGTNATNGQEIAAGQISDEGTVPETNEPVTADSGTDTLLDGESSIDVTAGGGDQPPTPNADDLKTKPAPAQEGQTPSLESQGPTPTVEFTQYKNVGQITMKDGSKVDVILQPLATPEMQETRELTAQLFQQIRDGEMKMLDTLDLSPLSPDEIHNGLLVNGVPMPIGPITPELQQQIFTNYTDFANQDLIGFNGVLRGTMVVPVTYGEAKGEYLLSVLDTYSASGKRIVIMLSKAVDTTKYQVGIVPRSGDVTKRTNFLMPNNQLVPSLQALSVNPKKEVISVFTWETGAWGDGQNGGDYGNALTHMLLISNSQLKSLLETGIPPDEPTLGIFSSDLIFIPENTQ